MTYDDYGNITSLTDENGDIYTTANTILSTES